MAWCLKECNHTSSYFSLRYSREDLWRDPCHLLPGLTGVIQYTHPCHCISDHSQWVGQWEANRVSDWDSGRWQLELHTLLPFALPCDPPKFLQAKEKGLKDTPNQRSSVEKNLCKLHTDHRLRQQPGVGMRLRKWTVEQFKSGRKRPGMSFGKQE